MIGDKRQLPASDDELLGRELDDLLLDLRGLVLVRQLLTTRGATQSELDDHTRRIGELRTKLADRVRVRTFAEASGAGPVADERQACAPRRRVECRVCGSLR
jgi:hypothetical protein